MEINRRFSSSVLVEMRRQIKEAGGNEVFFVGLMMTGLSAVYMPVRAAIFILFRSILRKAGMPMC